MFTTGTHSRSLTTTPEQVSICHRQSDWCQQ